MKSSITMSLWLLAALPASLATNVKLYATKGRVCNDKTAHFTCSNINSDTCCLSPTDGSFSTGTDDSGIAARDLDPRWSEVFHIYGFTGPDKCAQKECEWSGFTAKGCLSCAFDDGTPKSLSGALWTRVGERRDSGTGASVYPDTASLWDSQQGKMRTFALNSTAGAVSNKIATQLHQAVRDSTDAAGLSAEAKRWEVSP